MNRGFIGWLILIIIALALAKYFFDWSIFDALESEQGKETLDYIRNVINTAWDYVSSKVMEIYGKVS